MWVCFLCGIVLVCVGVFCVGLFVCVCACVRAYVHACGVCVCGWGLIHKVRVVIVTVLIPLNVVLLLVKLGCFHFLAVDFPPVV